jgi:hypothetical protein
LEGFVIGINRLASTDEDDALFHIPMPGNSEKEELHIPRDEEIIEEHTSPLH